MVGVAIATMMEHSCQWVGLANHAITRPHTHTHARTHSRIHAEVHGDNIPSFLSWQVSDANPVTEINAKSCILWNSSTL
jgi:hypothetical protein